MFQFTEQNYSDLEGAAPPSRMYYTFLKEGVSTIKRNFDETKESQILSNHF